jgi:hypothetical protein
MATKPPSKTSKRSKRFLNRIDQKQEKEKRSLTSKERQKEGKLR